MTLLAHIDSIPPYVCVALAKAGSRRMLFAEIADASGLTPRAVRRIACSLTWGRMRVEDVSAFARTCGVDLLFPSKTVTYLRRTIATGKPFKHLSERQRRRLQELDVKAARMRSGKDTV